MSLISNNKSDGGRSTSVSLLSWSPSTWLRWAAMPRMYMTAVPRTKFVLLKAPVSTLYEEKFGGDRFMFTVGMYAERCASKSLNVTLVLDASSLDLNKFVVEDETTTLTTNNETKYFHNIKDWEDYGMDYQSLHYKKNRDNDDDDGSSSNTNAVVEDEMMIRDFIQTCTSHWKDQPNSYIALYDARGGWGIASYLIACFMCQVYRAPVHVALASLGTLNKTSSGLCDLKLIQDLQTRYRGRTELKFDTSLVPSWWWLQQEEEDDDDEEEEKSGDPTTANASKEDMKEEKDSNSPVNIIKIPPFQEKKNPKHPNRSNNNNNNNNNDATAHLTKKTKPHPTDSILASCLMSLTVESSRYTRAMSVWKQLTNNNINPHPQKALVNITDPTTQIKHGHFKITWNPVGRHGYLLILMDGVYFLEQHIHNDNNPPQISQIQPPMHFPSPKNPNQQQHRTLLQVVLVQDKDNVPRFMVQDILAHNGGILTGKPWKQRFAFWMEGVLQLKKKVPPKQNEKIKLRAIEFFKVSQFQHVWSNVCPVVLHETDGIVWVPTEATFQNREEPCLIMRKNSLQNEATRLNVLNHLQPFS